MYYTSILRHDGYIIARRRWFAAKFLGRSGVSGNSEINNVASVPHHRRGGLTENHARKRYVSSGELRRRWIFFFLFFSFFSQGLSAALGRNLSVTSKIIVIARSAERMIYRSEIREDTWTPSSGKLGLIHRKNEMRPGIHRRATSRGDPRGNCRARSGIPEIPRLAIPRSTLERQPLFG